MLVANRRIWLSGGERVEGRQGGSGWCRRCVLHAVEAVQLCSQLVSYARWDLDACGVWFRMGVGSLDWAGPELMGWNG
jgi:hypothetical protein